MLNTNSDPSAHEGSLAKLEMYIHEMLDLLEQLPIQRAELNSFQNIVWADVG
jgi:hypothetical protein